jgi:hypothetical protein
MVKITSNLSSLCYIRLLTHSRLLPQTLTGYQLVKKFLPFFVTRRFITKCPPPVPILNQINPVHTPTSHFLKTQFNNTLPSTPASSKWSLSRRFPHQNAVQTSPLLHTCYMPRQSHSSRFITQVIFGEKHRSLSSSLCSFLHSPISYVHLNTSKRQQNAVNHRFRPPILHYLQKRRLIPKIQ